jgi:hypothetical protein
MSIEPSSIATTRAMSNENQTLDRMTRSPFFDQDGQALERQRKSELFESIEEK